MCVYIRGSEDQSLLKLIYGAQLLNFRVETVCISFVYRPMIVSDSPFGSPAYMCLKKSSYISKDIK
jgi:hypothetical protein